MTKKGRNFLIAFEDDQSVLLVPFVVDKYNLTIGRDIETGKLAEIRAESDLLRAEDYINYLLARRSYSIGEIAFKLKQKGYSEETARVIIPIFIERDLLDDKNFARELTASILRQKPAGKAYIIGKLRQKHIPQSMAQSVVDNMFLQEDEVDLAVRLLRGRWRHFSKFDLESARRKAYNYLSRRAIGYAAAKEAFEIILKEEGKD